jgi:hypothetical protein
MYRQRFAELLARFRVKHQHTEGGTLASRRLARRRLAAALSRGA